MVAEESRAAQLTAVGMFARTNRGRATNTYQPPAIHDRQLPGMIHLGGVAPQTPMDIPSSKS